MGEVIDDKVDKFHEALINRLYTKRALVVVAIGIALLATLYVRATYREYDREEYESSWSIVRRIVIIDGQLKELNISFGQFGFPMSYGANETTMIYCGNFTEKGHSVYWELADLADAGLQTVYHVVEFLGHVETRSAINWKMTLHYYYTLIHSPVFHYSPGMIMEPERERAHEEYNIRNPELLQDIALNKLTDLYRELRSQETIIVQGKEYPANFYGDGYFFEWEVTGLLPTVLEVNASPGEGSIDVLTRATTTITISGSIYPGFTAPINISIVSGGDVIGSSIGTVTTVTTSSNGEFSTSFIPISLGLYTITASFPGNDRYAASSASTLVNVRNNYVSLIKVLAIIIASIVVSALCFLRKKGRWILHLLDEKRRKPPP